MSSPSFPSGAVSPLEEAYLLGEINYLGGKECSQTNTSQHPYTNSILVLRTMSRTLFFNPTNKFPTTGRIKFGVTSPYIPVHIYTYTQHYWVEP